MNQAHLHLMLNHFPFLGALFGLCVFLVGWIKNERLLVQTGLITLLIAALFIIPVYITGGNATEIIENVECAEMSYVQQHENSALWATIAMMVTGSLALIALFLPVFTNELNTVRLMYAIILLSGLISIILMAYTAYEGGKISHPELI